jgi:hypothetical protein
VQDINPGNAASDPQDLVAMNNKLYFSADDGTHGRELWDPFLRHRDRDPPGRLHPLRYAGADADC